jgi:hypothetical protein
MPSPRACDDSPWRSPSAGKQTSLRILVKVHTSLRTHHSLRTPSPTEDIIQTRGRTSPTRTQRGRSMRSASYHRDWPRRHSHATPAARTAGQTQPAAACHAAVEATCRQCVDQSAPVLHHPLPRPQPRHNSGLPDPCRQGTLNAPPDQRSYPHRLKGLVIKLPPLVTPHNAILRPPHRAGDGCARQVRRFPASTTLPSRRKRRPAPRGTARDGRSW